MCFLSLKIFLNFFFIVGLSGFVLLIIIWLQDKNGGGSVKRAPLVDLSKPKEESAETSEPEAVEVEPVASIEAEARPEVVVEAKPAESAEAANPETEEQKVEIANALAEEKDKFVANALAVDIKLIKETRPKQTCA